MNFQLKLSLSSVGMLKDQQDGSVMKAAVKALCGIREIQFYEQLQKKEIGPQMEILRELVPEYRGTVKCLFRGKMIDFIKLADITHGMAEPCVIDIKIGKRTWDPFASAEKQKAEEQKYQACKKNLGFCVPGFQVYDIKTGRIKRYGKEYGKKMSHETVKDGESDIYMILELPKNRRRQSSFLLRCDLHVGQNDLKWPLLDD